LRKWKRYYRIALAMVILAHNAKKENHYFLGGRPQ
jgi:hypothetical protein